MPDDARQRRQRADARRNRESVLEAAKMIFAEKPAAYVSMADIAQATGVGVGTIYRHFSSRDELLAAVFTDEVERVCAAAQLKDGQSPGQSLAEWSHLFFSFARERSGVALELIASGGVHSQIFRQDRARFCEAGEPLLAAARASGEFGSRLDIGQLLDALVWLARGQAPEHHVRPMVDVLLDGLKQPD